MVWPLLVKCQINDKHLETQALLPWSLRLHQYYNVVPVTFDIILYSMILANQYFTSN